MQKIRPDMDIGKNIQTIRYANKLTQDQVIAKLNLMGISMSKSTYAKLETNRMNIKVSELVALAKIFHTDINAFFSGLLNRKSNHFLNFSCYIALSYSLRFSPTNPIVLFWYIFCLTFTTDCIPNPV